MVEALIAPVSIIFFVAGKGIRQWALLVENEKRKTYFVYVPYTLPAMELLNAAFWHFTVVNMYNDGKMSYRRPLKSVINT